MTPEDYLLSARAARLDATLSVEATADAKSEWVRIASTDLGRVVNGDDIFLIQEIEINKLDPADSVLKSIATIVSNFVQAVIP
jgi:hypothetical protein